MKTNIAVTLVAVVIAVLAMSLSPYGFADPVRQLPPGEIPPHAECVHQHQLALHAARHHGGSWKAVAAWACAITAQDVTQIEHHRREMRSCVERMYPQGLPLRMGR